MIESITIKAPPGTTPAQALEMVRGAASRSIEPAVNIIRDKVIDLTPRFTGGLQSHIYTRFPSPMSGETYGEGVVMAVHEKNAVWSKAPPIEALRGWVMGKLGVEESRSRSVAYLIARKIKRFGLTLPNKEGKGMMFKRTRDFMEQSHGHFVAFVAAMRQNLFAIFGGGF